MKWTSLKIPLGVRVFIFVLGAAAASMPIRAIYYGYFNATNHGTPIYISMAKDPLDFWALAIIFSLLSAGLFYGAFAKRLPDA